MKVLIQREELKQMVIEYLDNRNLSVNIDTLTEVTHTEGSYEDACEVFDGFSVELHTE